MTEKIAPPFDIIFVNNPSFKHLSGNTTISVSDHLPQFIVVENFKANNITSKRINTTYNEFHFFTENNDVNLGFETLLQLFHSILDRHILINKSKRKEEKFKSRSCVTKGIRNSTVIRDKLYNAMIKEKYESTKNQQKMRNL